MKSSRQGSFIALAVLVILSGLYIAKMYRPVADATATAHGPEQVTGVPAEASVSSAQQVELVSPQKASQPFANVDAIAAQGAPSAPTQSIKGLNASVPSRLREFAQLRRQVVPSAESKSKREQFLRDEEFMRELAPLLKEPANQSSSILELQNTAIDLLLDARAATHSAAAETALRSIVEDKRIEGTELDLASRKALAGLKGEVMYKWSAQEPSKAADIHSWLPGPVSEKIWQNALAAQKQNLLESQAEAAHPH